MKVSSIKQTKPGNIFNGEILKKPGVGLLGFWDHKFVVITESGEIRFYKDYCHTVLESTFRITRDIVVIQNEFLEVGETAYHI